MVGFNLPFKFPFKKAQNISGVDPSIKSTQPVVLKSSVTPQPNTKSLAELEKEAEEKYYATYPHKQPVPKKARQGVLSKIIWTAILLGMPVGVVWLANLPYPVISRPVARTAPILLLPSYMSVEANYRQAIASVEQAEQLIENATSPADLNLGEQKVKEAQKNLDALPVWFLNDWPEYRYWWYDWRFNIYAFNTARTKIGQLDAKVFQEKNAQMLLTDSEQALNTAKQQYQEASTPTDKQAALASWRSAINQLEQIPSVTLAGKTAQAKLENYQLDFQEVVGLAAGNKRVSTLIEGARQFSWEAAKAGQNPPHSVAEWEQVENLWEQAIAQLKQIRSDDLTGYAEAQKLLAQYSTNLGQVNIRQQAEKDSVEALQQAQSKIERLLAATPTDANSVDRNRTISKLQGIINDLDNVQNGTTAYLKAQALLLSAKNKLNQLQPR
jgi:DNA repair exonuclease SbcCD ATPase subunit